MMRQHIAVLGAGNMGTAVAQVLAKLSHRVWLWDYNRETVDAIMRTGSNARFLPGVKLSKRIVPEADMQKAVEQARLVIVACASPYVRSTVQQMVQCFGITPPTSPYLKGRNRSIVAHVVKGLEPKTNLTMHEVVQSELPVQLRRGVVTISGPSIAKEFVCGVPTGVVAASQDNKATELVRRVFEDSSSRSKRTVLKSVFKVAVSSDWKGVSICGALKNVYAIALGMCDGMRLTMNAKAFMFTIALAEMEQVVVVLGGKRQTVYGLFGAGDMVVTGLGDGRNRALGERICKEGHCKFVWAENTQTHEGVATTKVFYELTRHKKIFAPLLGVVYQVLYRGADPCAEIMRFFARVKI